MNKKYQRSTTYRKEFFSHNKGLFGSDDKYQCAYCGKILNRKKIQIDHLIPVNKVKKFGTGRILMKIRNIDNINSVKNLVPSCEKCNKTKSSKMGCWIIRGLLGKHFSFWVVIWIIKLIILVAIIYFSINLYNGNININLEQLFGN